MTEKKYFAKALVSNRIIDTSGNFIPFEAVGDGTGIIETSSKPVIDAIEKFISERRAGVYAITSAEYDERKKKASESQSQLASSPQPSLFRVTKEFQQPHQKSEDAAEVNPKSLASEQAKAPVAEQVQQETTVIKPTVGRPPKREKPQ